ncbi:hypothetical protein HK101_003556, partial [Irineochytrium annulatum]
MAHRPREPTARTFPDSDDSDDAYLVAPGAPMRRVYPAMGFIPASSYSAGSTSADHTLGQVASSSLNPRTSHTARWMQLMLRDNFPPPHRAGVAGSADGGPAGAVGASSLDLVSGMLEQREPSTDGRQDGPPRLSVNLWTQDDADRHFTYAQSWRRADQGPSTALAPSRDAAAPSMPVEVSSDVPSSSEQQSTAPTRDSPPRLPQPQLSTSSTTTILPPARRVLDSDDDEDENFYAGASNALARPLHDVWAARGGGNGGNGGNARTRRRLNPRLFSMAFGEARAGAGVGNAAGPISSTDGIWSQVRRVYGPQNGGAAGGGEATGGSDGALTGAYQPPPLRRVLMRVDANGDPIPNASAPTSSSRRAIDAGESHRTRSSAPPRPPTRRRQPVWSGVGGSLSTTIPSVPDVVADAADDSLNDDIEEFDDDDEDRGRASRPVASERPSNSDDIQDLMEALLGLPSSLLRATAAAAASSSSLVTTTTNAGTTTAPVFRPRRNAIYIPQRRGGGAGGNYGPRLRDLLGTMHARQRGAVVSSDVSDAAAAAIQARGLGRAAAGGTGAGPAPRNEIASVVVDQFADWDWTRADWEWGGGAGRTNGTDGGAATVGATADESTPTAVVEEATAWGESPTTTTPAAGGAVAWGEHEPTTTTPPASGGTSAWGEPAILTTPSEVTTTTRWGGPTSPDGDATGWGVSTATASATRWGAPPAVTPPRGRPVPSDPAAAVAERRAQLWGEIPTPWSAALPRMLEDMNSSGAFDSANVETNARLRAANAPSGAGPQRRYATTTGPQYWGETNSAAGDGGNAFHLNRQPRRADATPQLPEQQPTVWGASLPRVLVDDPTNDGTSAAADASLIQPAVGGARPQRRYSRSSLDNVSDDAGRTAMLDSFRSRAAVLNAAQAGFRSTGGTSSSSRRARHPTDISNLPSTSGASTGPDAPQYKTADSSQGGSWPSGWWSGQAGPATGLARLLDGNGDARDDACDVDAVMR